MDLPSWLMTLLRSWIAVLMIVSYASHDSGLAFVRSNMGLLYHCDSMPLPFTRHSREPGQLTKQRTRNNNHAYAQYNSTRPHLMSAMACLRHCNASFADRTTTMQSLMYDSRPWLFHVNVRSPAFSASSTFMMSDWRRATQPSHNNSKNVSLRLRTHTPYMTARHL